MGLNMHPFEYAIVCFLKENSPQRFTTKEIAENTSMDPKTAKKRADNLFKCGRINKVKVRKKIELYYIQGY